MAGLGYKPDPYRAMAGGRVGHHAVRDPYARSPEQATPPADEDGRAAETPFTLILEARLR